MALRHRIFCGKPHICFVAPDFFSVVARNAPVQSAGGAEVQQSFVARGLLDAGFPVTVITHAAGQPDEFDLDGIRIVRIDRSGKEIPLLRNIHPRLTSIWNALYRADADIYYQRCAGANTLVVGLFSRRYGRRFIYSGASDPDFQRDQLWKKFQGRGGWRNRVMYQWGLRLADAIVAQHAGQVDACRRWYWREAMEIPNCYTLPPDAVATREGVVLWVSSVKSLKRPELFLDLARALPHLRFRMVGGVGPEKEADVFMRIRQAAAKLPNVEFVGFVPFPEVDAHFYDARLFVNTSEYEGFPNTFLQSWARGIPTVSFVDCGAREGDRQVGYVCGDLAEMKKVVSRLCEDDAVWAQEGARARQHFLAHHTVDIVMARYGRLIGQLVGSGGRD